MIKVEHVTKKKFIRYKNKKEKKNFVQIKI